MRRRLVSPRIGRPTKLALDHPWLVALVSAVLMGCWVGGVLRGTLWEAVVAAVVVGLVQVVLWSPRVGLARVYAERILADQSDQSEDDPATSTRAPDQH